MDSHRQGLPGHHLTQNEKVHENLGEGSPAPFINMPGSKMTLAPNVSSPKIIMLLATGHLSNHDCCPRTHAWGNHNGSSLDGGKVAEGRVDTAWVGCLVINSLSTMVFGVSQL